MGKYRFENQLGRAGPWLVVEELRGEDQYATLSLRENRSRADGGGEPGKRIFEFPACKQAELVELGLGLLGVARAMVPETAMVDSKCRAGADGEPDAKALQALERELAGEDLDDTIEDHVELFKRRRARLPLLRQCLRVLESVETDEEVRKLGILLDLMEATGRLPFGINVGIATENEPAAAPSMAGRRTH